MQSEPKRRPYIWLPALFLCMIVAIAASAPSGYQSALQSNSPVQRASSQHAPPHAPFLMARNAVQLLPAARVEPPLFTKSNRILFARHQGVPVQPLHTSPAAIDAAETPALETRPVPVAQAAVPDALPIQPPPAETAAEPEEVSPGQTETEAAEASEDIRQAAPPVTGTNRDIGYSMMLEYWGPGQWDCLERLWTEESGWDETKSNYEGSGAYGIPQALPGSKMASMGADWEYNPVTQIAWGLSYISNRYGTPCAAMAHKDNYGWY